MHYTVCALVPAGVGALPPQKVASRTVFTPGASWCRIGVDAGAAYADSGSERWRIGTAHSKLSPWRRNCFVVLVAVRSSAKQWLASKRSSRNQLPAVVGVVVVQWRMVVVCRCRPAPERSRSLATQYGCCKFRRQAMCSFVWFAVAIGGAWCCIVLASDGGGLWRRQAIRVVAWPA